MNDIASERINGDHHPVLPAASMPDVGNLLSEPCERERPTRYRLSTLSNSLKLADVISLLAAGTLAHLFRFGFDTPISPAGNLLIYLSMLVSSICLHAAHAYKIRTVSSLYTMLNTLLIGGAAALIVMLVLGYLSGMMQVYSRIWLASSVLLSAALLFMNRIVLTQIMRRAVQKDRLSESIVVVGANERAERMIETIRATPNANVKILGIFDDRLERTAPPSAQSQMLGSTATMLKYIRQHHVDRVVVTLPWGASKRIDALLKKLRTVPVRIDLVPSDVVWQFPSINMERLGSVPVLTVANGRVDEQMGAMKRVEDLVISSLLLLLISPLLIIIAIAIKLDSKGPVIFKQRRHGFNNEVFEVYKFRSMTAAETSSSTVVQATRDDRRVTRLGKFLRRSSLDELPQLFNVWFGDMSIVGPRPHAVQHNVQYGAVISEYFARHNVKPGITGWAQVSGLRGETDTLEKMHNRVQYDIHYIENWSLGLDLKILLMTGIAVWFDPNAY